MKMRTNHEDGAREQQWISTVLYVASGFRVTVSFQILCSLM